MSELESVLIAAEKIAATTKSDQSGWQIADNERGEFVVGLQGSGRRMLAEEDGQAHADQQEQANCTSTTNPLEIRAIAADRCDRAER